jgi:hypothetical protein
MSQTKLERFQKNAQTQKFISVIGHGTLINPHDPSFNSYNSTHFTVPEGMSVIFISKPGYFISLRSLKDDNMMNLLLSQNKLRQFIDDKLPANETPEVVRRSYWNWKNHIYTSGMTCPNMGFEFYDKAETSWGRWYNIRSGVWFPGTNRRPEYKGKKGTLKNLVSSLHMKGILVVFGCRGDPQTYERTKHAFSTFGTTGRQNYSVPRSALVRNIKTLERAASRYMTAKRIHEPSLSLRRRSVNGTSPKRRRTNNRMNTN